MNKNLVLIYFFLVSISIMHAQNVGIGTLSPGGKLHIKGAADSSQLIIEAHSTQSNTSPLFKLRNSFGNDLLWLHADDTSNVFLGLHAGGFNSISGGGAYNTLIGSNAGKSNISGAFNTANGAGALFSNTSGANNTALGSVSLFSNTTGPGNTAIGSNSLSANTTGYNNTSNGYGSMFSNTEGSENTANGQEALFSNTTGSYNTAYGLHALASNIVGNSATAIGYNAMRYANNTTESFTNYNVAVGYEALRGSTNPSSNTGNDNTALGYQTLRSNTTGEGNTASGSGALFYNTTGLANTATGTYSLNNNTTGNHNTALGYRALEASIAGDYNTATGSNALSYNNTGMWNTGIGSSALHFNLEGSANVALGNAALLNNTYGSSNTANGTDALFANLTGSNNTAIGKEALYANLTGSNNTAIGYNADVAAGDLENATAIGSNAYAGASNSVVIGSINGVNGATANANVGIGTTTPNASSALDINSTTKGLLPPRMTDSQRNSIVSPVEGLLIWCTNCGIYGQLQVYNGIIWTNMIGGAPAGSLAIGDSDGGGKIAYLLQAGDPGYVAGENHGLIAAPFDQSGAEWGCYLSGIPGADGTALGTGNQNTIDIVNGCATPGIAARICNDLVLGGYSDWYLPSKDELNKLYLNRVAIGGFETYENYWSSSEFDISFAWHQGFNGGGQYYNLVGKPDTLFVRAVRGF